MEKVRRDRTFYRAKFIPLDELYTKEELQDLLKEFGTGANEKEFINIVNLNAVLVNMNFDLIGNFFFNFWYRLVLLSCIILFGLLFKKLIFIFYIKFIDN